ncbi:DNA-formamidopyrimidine glycosylase [Candidatus Falkowbacteria bacterium RIFOXYA2_FULL_35_8]|uniref:DNA-formamidopyrimidine glycosylase n=1 Tax=Candidatus Falkowbacteria bacterium RIFOXYC2_FULL_36_12 TaxID=1798002 RepID=A0A1F5SYE4_9BACT|nr:MAG: DNA-formamidopyrimidine glycosylase [Candidatus Falkowbacteria bacterium RIFOXYC2_FULL_36_12]OGF32002.1 MAG: DNA-formamidopyrimidine glycosylase [Candidatus Falkowbacteria bacterium RIFOXYB2_FULL_35_7]OGF34042.1 MAG: DNA-formamidopyrimidine glycosylase [Candidatus Falkowbacteria bacterium RIFOXYA2_FULL_35_8]
MPELPEVETVRRDLDKFVKGKKVIEINISADFAKKIQPSMEELIRAVENRVLKNITRTGKMLVFDFGKNKKVLAHMKMTGQFVFVHPVTGSVSAGHPIKQISDQPHRFNKVFFNFGRHGKLYYNDIRKFGYLKLVNDQLAELEQQKFGIEPVDRKFTMIEFTKLLDRRPDWSIKKFLLTQDLISGIGNIYADEACFEAGILCTRKVQTLTSIDRENIRKSLKSILKKAIKYRGSSVNTYVDGSGQRGSYAQFLRVYGRAGEPCLRCGQTEIKKIKLVGRGTSFCPNCQK